MNITIKSRNFQVSDRTKGYIEKKVAKLNRFLPTISDVRVELVEEKTKSDADRFVAQITVHAERKILRSEERNLDVTTAFDLSLDKMHSQIVRVKGKKLNRWQANESIRHAEDFPPLSEEMFNSLTQEEDGEIIKVKQFSVTAMSEEEAIEQMELLSHNFFVFYNANSGRMNVLYKRADQNYGLIDPILS